MSVFEQDLNLQVDLWMLADANAYSSRCLGYITRTPADGYDIHLAVLGLVAAYRLQSAEAVAASLVAKRLERAPPPTDGNDERCALASLLHRLGKPGARALVRLSDGSAPVADNDAEWAEFLTQRASRIREAAPTSEPDDEPYSGDRLLWSLTGDSEALGRLQRGHDSLIAALADLAPGAIRLGAGDALVDDVLVIAPTDGGVSDGKLKEWATQDSHEGLRWAADLALARRGDSSAEQRVHEIIKQRFGLRTEEEGAARRDMGVAPVGSQFGFVLELARTRLPDRWDLLLDVLSDRNPTLLPARAAVVLAVEEHYADLDAGTEGRVIRAMADLQWAEEDTWLRTLMLSCLGRHPRQEADGQSGRARSSR